MTTNQEKNGTETKSFGQRFFNWASLLLALLALVVPTYISVKGDQSKSLQVEHQRLLNIVNAESNKAPALRVLYDGAIVSKPWLYTARVENNGTVPIQKADIEEALTFFFMKSRILHAELALRKPDNVGAELRKIGEGKLQLVHALLNPQDSLVVEVLLDGDQELPQIASRISGIKSLSITSDNLQDKDTRQRGPVPVPKTIRQTAIFFGAFIAFVFALSSLMAFGSAIRKITKSLKRPELRSAISIGDEIALYIRRAMSTRNDASPMVMMAIAALGGNVDAKWFDDPSTLSAELENRLGSDLLARLGVSAPTLADEVLSTLRQFLPNAIAMYYFIKAPSGLDEILKTSLSGTEFRESSLSAYLSACDSVINREVEAMIKRQSDKGWPSLVSWSDIWAGVVLVGCSAAVTLLVLISSRSA